jgi:hypothetical protein
VEQLRLLSKVEKAGILSPTEKLCFCLSKIESQGLLSKEEELGILSIVTDPNTPRALLNLAIALLIVGPLCAYFVPDDSSWEVALQFVVTLLFVFGGPTIFSRSNLMSEL